MVVESGSGAFASVGASYFERSAQVLAIPFFPGLSTSGIGIFLMGIISAETVQGKAQFRALRMVIATGVLVGGLTGPLIAGWSADRWGIGASLLVQAACAALAAFAAMALRETAPRRVAAMAAHDN